MQGFTDVVFEVRVVAGRGKKRAMWGQNTDRDACACSHYAVCMCVRSCVLPNYIYRVTVRRRRSEGVEQKIKIKIITRKTKYLRPIFQSITFFKHHPRAVCTRDKRVRTRVFFPFVPGKYTRKLQTLPRNREMPLLFFIIIAAVCSVRFLAGGAAPHSVA